MGNYVTASVTQAELCVCISSPKPGMNGLEPAFGEAYSNHRGLLSPYPPAMSPQGGRTEYNQVGHAEVLAAQLFHHYMTAK